jgi:hypothetical protein
LKAPENLSQKECDMELANLRECLQDDVLTYFGGYENSIPFTYTNEQHETFIDDICGIIVSKINEQIK